MGQGLRIERWSERVPVLVIDRPQRRNVLDHDLLAAIAGAVVREGADAGAIVLRGAGGHAFSAGFDLDLLNGSEADLEADASIGRAVRAIVDCPAPVIAMIEGHCHGAGVELALSCDVRLASTELKLSLQAVSLGVVYRYELISRLVQLAGLGRAADLLLARPTLGAPEALAWGLVTEVVIADGIEARAKELAEMIAASPRSAVQGTKSALRTVADRAIDARDLESIRELRRLAIASGERKAALAAARKRLGRS